MYSEKEILVDLLKNPDQFLDEGANFLSLAVPKFPYCTSLHLINVRYNQLKSGIQEGSLVNLAAVYCPDRTILFNLMNRPVFKSELSEEKLDQPIGKSELNEEELNLPISVAELSEQEPLPKPSTHVTFYSTFESKGKEILEEGKISNSFRSVNTNSLESMTSPEPIIAGSIRKNFLYWLKKTQKGYFLKQGSFSNVSNRIQKSGESSSYKLGLHSDSLESGYQMNIFHLGALTSANSKNTVEFDLSKKEDQIIEKFLKEDPQHISPYNSEKTDFTVEHQVEKASRDSSEMVSETLASIYLQQKLYEKAIMAYEKLSLKMPEKRTYFASIIKKIKDQSI